MSGGVEVRVWNKDSSLAIIVVLIRARVRVSSTFEIPLDSELNNSLKECL